MNLLDFAAELIQPVVDFSSLSTLVLESCVGLEAALPVLMEAETAKRKGNGALQLHTLAIRHENATDECLQSLERFLLSLKPLTHLHILLEGRYEEPIELRKVLQIHGNHLHSFVYDERLAPRESAEDDMIASPADSVKNLIDIANHCPSLKALGISLHWEEIQENQKKVKERTAWYIDLCADLP